LVGPPIKTLNLFNFAGVGVWVAVPPPPPPPDGRALLNQSPYLQ
jgi:hypothetical protein